MARKQAKRSANGGENINENRRCLRSSTKQTQHQPSSSSAYCLFCFKTIDQTRQPRSLAVLVDSINESESAAERLKSCQLFCDQLSGYSVEADDLSLASPSVETLSLFWNDQRGKLKKNYVAGSIYGACTDCFFVINAYSDTTKQIEELQLVLKNNLETLYNVMKYAGKVGPRVQKFKDSFRPSPASTKSMVPGKKADKLTTEVSSPERFQLADVLKVRKTIFRTCSKRLNHKQPSPSSLEKHEDNNVKIVKVIKREVEQVTLNLHPSIYPVEDSNDDCREEESFPWAGASWVGEASSCISSVAASQFHQCKKCPQAFDTEEDLKWHESTNHFATAAACRFKEPAPRSTEENKEIENKIAAERSTFACQFCDFSSNHVESLVNHETLHHTIDAIGASSTPVKIHAKRRNRVACARCPQLLSRRMYDRTRHYLKNHIKGHTQQLNQLENVPTGGATKDKYHICTVCKKTFQHRQTLEEHLKTHSKERPFRCLFCDEMLCREDDLIQHFKTTHANIANKMK